MKLENNNLGTLPLDLIVSLMKLVLGVRFKDFYNFFMAWAQTQRRPGIVLLLEHFPLRDVYNSRQVAATEDVNYFDRFFRIAEQLRIKDAIFYARCSDILCGVGNLERHLTVLDNLALSREFLYMIGNFVFKVLYKKQGMSARTLQELVAIRHHPYYRMSIAPSLTHLKSIKHSVAVSKISPEIYFGVTCAFHDMDLKRVQENGVNVCGMSDECLFCHIAVMLNVFTTNST